MAIKHPRIDDRSFREILRQILGDPANGFPADVPLYTRGLRHVYTPEWISQREGEPGHTLAYLFARLMEIVLERLNGAPEKNFVAFLDLLGIDRLPGNPARTPLFFTLPAGSAGGLVTAGTQAATKPTERGTVHIFETEKALFVTPARLQKIFSVVAAKDMFSDVSFLAASSESSALLVPASAFIEHAVYLAHDTLLGFPEPANLTIEVQTAPSSPPLTLNWEVRWQRCEVDDEGNPEWKDMFGPLSPPSFAGQLVESGTALFVDFEGTGISTQGDESQGGGKARWIRALLTTPLTDSLTAPESLRIDSLPKIQSLMLAIDIDASGLSLDAAFFNAVSLDVSKDFHPFGKEPQLADTLYLASDRAFSKPGATIILDVTLSSGIDYTVTPSTAPALSLVWEGWSGSRWESVSGLNDGSSNFSTAGQITFTLPSSVAPRTVNGVVSHWVRVRILQGNYGLAGHYRPVPATSPVEYEFVPGNFTPPVLSAISLTYSKSYPLQGPQKLLTFNDFRFCDRLSSGGPFLAFEPFPEKEPALYLGFDRVFGDVPVSLYFQIVDAVPGATVTETAPQAQWEYSAPGGWRSLELQADETANFVASGTVSFLGPDDQAEAEHFKRRLYWVRIVFQIVPSNRLINGVFVNAVMAANETTIRDEVLGSGNGEAGQSVSFSQKPVLPGEKVIVRESEPPSEEEISVLQAAEELRLGQTLTKKEKDELVQTRQNSATGATETWVRWLPVSKFYASGSRSRHYVTDRVNGTLIFGDGRKGMLPPVGRDNIQAFFYRSGGGAVANREVKAGSVKELRSFLPFVDKVTNVAAAAGGSDPESTADVLERGPQTIKNRDRAVTIEDYVWLAKQASTEVHEARCLPTLNDKLEFEPGAVTVLLVPDTDEAQPRPSQQLVRTVRDYLRKRALPIIQPTIYIIPPQYVTVDVEAEAAPLSLEEAPLVESRIRGRLEEFLHPVRGGPEARGWDFGRNVYISEIHQLIEDTEGVDVVLSVELNGDPTLSEVVVGDNELPSSGSHEIVMKSPG